jgi:phenylalanyl-tRNA synthetase alpha chain
MMSMSEEQQEQQAEQKIGGVDVDSLHNELMAMIAQCESLDELEQARVTALGKKGRITAAMKTLGHLDAETRKARGQALNQLKDEIGDYIQSRHSELKAREREERLAREQVDITLPVRPEAKGAIHPLSQTIEEVTTIFGEMGFSAAQGPSIEDDWHNFTALNIPPDHPAREMQDTFFLQGQDPHGAPYVLRTHTSPVQIRSMETSAPPYKLISYGRTYRVDWDMTHTPMFHQVEGLYIDQGVHMGHLKGCLMDFLRKFFEVEDLPVRFRPSFFPFTEPSAEADIGFYKQGDQIHFGQADDPDDQDWMEILGCGMVHPNVLSNCGVDPDQWQGFAFGMGLERITMLKHGMRDLRPFFEADLRWLDHYGFDPLNRPNRAFRTL